MLVLTCSHQFLPDLKPTFLRDDIIVAMLCLASKCLAHVRPCPWRQQSSFLQLADTTHNHPASLPRLRFVWKNGRDKLLTLHACLLLQVAGLFRRHDDLLQEFTYFLPDSTAPAAQHVSLWWPVGFDA